MRVRRQEQVIGRQAPRQRRRDVIVERRVAVVRIEQPLQALRHRNWLCQLVGQVEGPHKLECVEGIAPGCLVNAQDGGPRQRPVEPVVQELVYRTEAERSYRDALCVDRLFNVSDLGAAPSYESQNLLGA